MSREVIRDIVIPIVTRIMSEEGYFGPYREQVVRDEQLEQFLEEQMRRMFGVIGANGCQHLKEQLEEAKKNDPYAFEFVLRQLMRKYVKLQIKVRQLKKGQTNPQGFPDRFAEQRKRYNLLFDRQKES
ncbi:MAG TPA: hypothetical protein VMT42_06275 [candidate division Zixibacteria bacterium]|nr:hypothetical protein [candidate division Zixibacteria bacterium]